MTTSPVVREATRRSGVIWVTLPGEPPRAVWHVWHEAAAYLVCGGTEQPLPGAAEADTAQVLVRSRERQGDQAARWSAAVHRVVPGTPEWEEVVPLLASKRLNSAPPAELAGQWASTATVLALTPLPVSRPGA